MKAAFVSAIVSKSFQNEQKIPRFELADVDSLKTMIVMMKWASKKKRKHCKFSQTI